MGQFYLSGIGKEEERVHVSRVVSIVTSSFKLKLNDVDGV